MTDTATPVRLLRLHAVRERCGGLSKVAIWRMRRAGTFPEPVRVGHAVFWIEGEVDEWLEERRRERDQLAAR